ncbi:MAG: two component transcriptional regulator, LuxR family [Chitinophagaceae bacterium]|nr:two component transcriptional regulator, LuxR family [Chitinophagaceae bacterium]
MIKIAIADDHKILREGLKAIFDAQPDMKVCAEAADGKELLEKVRAGQPDIILADIMMPVMDGIMATAEIKKEFPDIKIIVLTMARLESYVVRMLEAGAMGYLAKNSGSAEMLDAIRSVHQGIPYFCNSSSEKLVRMISKSAFNPFDHSSSLPEFTATDKAIIRLMCEQKTNKEIAAELFLSKRTVEWHRTNLQEKMQVKNAVGIVLYAIKNGLYILPSDHAFL